MTQKKLIEDLLKNGSKSINDLVNESSILRPNIRRILGTGAKEGTFERLDKGVYTLKTQSKISVIHVDLGLAQEILPRLIADGCKYDMVFLDPAYYSPNLVGRNKKPANYNFIMPEDFAKVMQSVAELVRWEDSHIYLMLSGAVSTQKDMNKYLDAALSTGLKFIGEGHYKKLYEEFTEYLLVEKSIGSEAVRLKWYPDVDKSIFYKIVNIDPTSIRKEGFSKLGKYSKWLLLQHKKGNLPTELLDDEKFRNKLSLYLFIFSTNFYKSKNIVKFYLGGSDLTNYSNIDINSFKTISDFTGRIDTYYDEWQERYEDGKYDLIYKDANIIILAPLNFATCRKYSISTDWCSQSLPGYNSWKGGVFMYRFIPVSNERNKCRLSWYKRNINKWSWASRKYPEFASENLYKNDTASPFEFKKFNTEEFEDMKNFQELKSVWSLLTPEAIRSCEEYFHSSQDEPSSII